MTRTGMLGFGTRDVGIDTAQSLTALPSGVTYDTTVFRTSGASLKIIPASGSAVSFFPTANLLGAGTFRRYVIRVQVRPASASQVIIGASGSGVNIAIKTDGTLTYSNGGTLIGTSTTALTDTTRWYSIGVRWANGSSVPVLTIDDNPEIIGSPSSWTITDQIGRANSVADTYTINFADLSADDTSIPTRIGKCAFITAVSDNAVGSGWTGSDGLGTNLWDCLNNTPPTGIADTTANAGHQIRNASSTSAVYTANMQSYAAAGIGLNATVHALLHWIITGAPVSTGAKTGNFSLTNPTVTSETITAGGGTIGQFWDGVAAGTYQTGWKVSYSNFLTNPTVTLSGAATMSVTLSGGTASRVAIVCAMGMYVDYTPALGLIYVPGLIVARPQILKPRTRVFFRG